MSPGTNPHAMINVTPLIDVLLVLLIIFLVITPQHSVGLEAKVPQPPDGAPQETLPQPVVVSIAADRSMRINSQAVTAGDLADRLREVFARRASKVLFVEGAASLEFADVASVIDTAREAGIHDCALVIDRGAAN